VEEQRTHVARIFDGYRYEFAISNPIFFNLESPATKGASLQVPIAPDAVE
jgi:hypothetical protein